MKLNITSIFIFLLLFDITAKNNNELSVPIVSNIVISLGNCCKVARFLRQSKINTYSYPLDWVLSSMKSIFLLFENDFKDYFQKDSLVDLNYWDRTLHANWPHGVSFRFVYDTKYQIESRHDFKNIQKDYHKVQEKYKRRIKRLYVALQSKNKVWLVRKKISKIEAITLRSLIKIKFPKLNFVIVALDNTSEIKENWNIPGIKNFYIDDPTYKYNVATEKFEYNPVNNYYKYKPIFESIGFKPLEIIDLSS